MEIKAPGILARKSVHEPVQTGLKAVDSLIPIDVVSELIIGTVKWENCGGIGHHVEQVAVNKLGDKTKSLYSVRRSRKRSPGQLAGGWRSKTHCSTV